MVAINVFEEFLAFDNNIYIFKFYFYLFYEQQKEELQECIDEFEKYWKYNFNDWKECEYWDIYWKYYEYVINESCIFWMIVLVDKCWYWNYIVVKMLVE